jgi:hypothetical protein
MSVFAHLGPTLTLPDLGTLGEDGIIFFKREIHSSRLGFLLIRQRREEDVFKQFAEIDSGFWAWDFWLKDKDQRGSDLTGAGAFWLTARSCGVDKS